MGIVLAKTLNVSSPASVAKYVNTLAPAPPELLAEAIRFPTIMQEDSRQVDYTPFTRWREYLRARFPQVHLKLELTPINEHSLLYTWRGRQAARPAILLTGHYDVVPADDVDHESKWQTSPFSGEIRDGFIWGRGAMDDKAGIIAMLWAVESLLVEGFQPESTVLLAFGHDEEVGGRDGAAHIANYLRQRNIRPAWLLDEGMPITEGIISVVNRPVAMVGIAEKGYLTLELTAQGDGGHTSAPPLSTAVDVIAQALSRLQKHPLKPRLDGAVSAMFERLTPEMNILPRALFANRWLFEPLLLRQLAAKNSTNAMIRTTAAATMLHGSTKENVLPTRAWARINFRLLPGDRIEDVISHVKSVTKESNVDVAVVGNASEASSLSRTDGPGFRAIEQAVSEIFPAAVAAPALLIAITDTRHYADLVTDIYRFRPILVGPQDVKRFHGVDERLGVENFQSMVSFYRRLLVNTAHTDGAALNVAPSIQP